MSTVQYSARLSGLIFFLLLSSVYSQDASSQLEVVYQYHADSLTGRVVKGMVGDTSYFPYDKRNQWQFKYSRQGGPPPIPVILINSVSAESVINNKVYRKYTVFGKKGVTWNSIRYDSTLNKLFVLINNTEVSGADFHYSDTSAQTFYSIMDNFEEDFLVHFNNYNFINFVIPSQWYYLSLSGSYRRYIYSKGLGWIFYDFYACCQGGTNQSLYTLDQAVIWDSLGKTMYYNPDNKPFITSNVPDTVVSLIIPLEIQVAHPHNSYYHGPSIPFEFHFIKSVNVSGIYVNNGDTILQNNPVILSRVPISDRYNGTIELNDSLLQSGYEYFYRIHAVDLGLMPLSDTFPDSGYKKINYKPVVSSVQTESENSLQISISGYPNPLSNAATFRYTVPVSGEVELKIFDILGNELFTVFKQSVSAGSYTYQYSDFKLPSGIYIARLVSNGKSVATKIKILK